jgi:hypothetical protein
MGRVLAALILMAASTPLHAEDSAWCVRLDAFTKNCAFATYNECMAVAVNANGPATGASSCIRNPDYKPPQAAKPAKAKSAAAPSR